MSPQFDQELKEYRALPQGVLEILKNLPTDGHPMVALQTAVAALGTFHPHMDVTGRDGNRTAALRLIASMPTIVAGFDRIRKGLEPIAPDMSLNHAANFLYMLSGERSDDKVTRLIDVCLVLHKSWFLPYLHGSCRGLNPSESLLDHRRCHRVTVWTTAWWSE